LLSQHSNATISLFSLFFGIIIGLSFLRVNDFLKNYGVTESCHSFSTLTTSSAILQNFFRMNSSIGSHSSSSGFKSGDLAGDLVRLIPVLLRVRLKITEVC